MPWLRLELLHLKRALVVVRSESEHDVQLTSQDGGVRICSLPSCRAYSARLLDEVTALSSLANLATSTER